MKLSLNLIAESLSGFDSQVILSTDREFEFSSVTWKVSEVLGPTLSSDMGLPAFFLTSIESSALACDRTISISVCFIVGSGFSTAKGIDSPVDLLTGGAPILEGSIPVVI